MNTQNKTILMIRERTQAADFIAELDMQGPVVFAPMVQIVPMQVDQVLPNATGIIFTSANAVRFYAKATKDRNAQVYCVGSQTERAAKGAGFRVTQRFETAAQLVAHFNAMPNPLSGIFYPRAETVAVDIAKELSDAGHHIEDAIFYRQAFQALPDKAKGLIESSSLIVPIFSHQIAKRFRQGLIFVKPCDLTIMCISTYVASVFDDLSGFRIDIAQKPTRAAMVDKIKASLLA
ncbi:MAG: uroporphyrinogen-III synthase [Rhodobacterales bacterium]